MQIKGNVFIVTGGASGLGEGTAKLLSQAGGKVVIADMQDEKGQAQFGDFFGCRDLWYFRLYNHLGRLDRGASGQHHEHGSQAELAKALRKNCLCVHVPIVTQQALR